ncbi:hypothetical protein B0T14DRAFT_272027 [Immersiella caudata]|uniref:Uncharacterized protein n=1 Tax=Immersiella caudata TaxID=314043 RepID=A0AA39WLC5_9PEZI|nr:hypothetical protein B0T14DRAFT_272027 [Immersiella caudata]
MDRSSNSDFAREPFSPYQDANIPLMLVGHSTGNGYFPQQTPAAVPRRERYTAWRLLIDLASIAWIAPIVFAIYINTQSWVVGRGISCRSLHPNPYCTGGLFAADRHERLAALYEEDKAILASLQIVSKALETWFSIIATSVVFSVTMHLARSPDGLPLGHLFTHVSFPDVLGLFDRGLWTSWTGRRRPESVLRLCGFIFLVVVLCITSNLMGPATAILIIPQLGSPIVEIPVTDRFERISADLSPAVANMAPECSPTELTAGNFSCTAVYASSLDEMSSGSKLRMEMFLRHWSPGPIVTEHDGVLFTVNATNGTDGIIAWAPSRRALSEITADLIEVEAIQGLYWPNDTSEVITKFGRTPDPVAFDKYNNTLDMTLHRVLPSLGFSSACVRASGVIDYTVSTTKSVSCVNITLTTTRYAVSCSRTGTGWADIELARSQFFVADTSDVAWPSNVSVDVFTTTKEAYFNNTDPPCGSTSSCDWERIFSREAGRHPDLGLLMDVRPQQLTLYSKTHPFGHHAVLCTSYPYLSFPEYVIHVFPDQNPIRLTQLRAPLGDNAYQHITFHPDWISAAWSLNKPSDIVEATRPAAMNLVSALKSIGSPPQFPEDNDEGLWMFLSQHQVATFHAMTFVNFSTTKIQPRETDDDPIRPFLRVYKTLRVYMYDSKSRTFKAAAAVCGFGCLVAFFRPIISNVVSARRPSTLRVAVAALQHPPLQSLSGAQKERDLGRLSVRVVPHPEDQKGVVLQALQRGF